MDRGRRNLLIGGSLVGTLAIAGLLPAACAKQPSKRKSAATGNGRQKRSSGEPKPMLDDDITPVLARSHGHN